LGLSKFPRNRSGLKKYETAKKRDIKIRVEDYFMLGCRLRAEGGD